MTYGIDTTFLVQLDVASHANHANAVALRDSLLDDGHDFAPAPQVITEYVHIVTDPRRFSKPVSMAIAIAQSRAWWHAAEVRHVHPQDNAVVLFHSSMLQHGLGRKRVLDTILAATYYSAGVPAIVSTDTRDYRSFVETVVVP